MTIPSNNLGQVVAFLRVNQQEIMKKLDYIKIGPGDPEGKVLAQKGTLWIRTDEGADQNKKRIYINKDGKKTWTNLSAGG